MEEWLLEALAKGREVLPEEAEGYLIGRGVQSTTLQWLGMAVWCRMDTKAPDATFRDRYGDYGQNLVGRLAYPLLSPKGSLIGFESRSMEEKSVTRYILDQAAWNPILIGFPRAMEKLWNGGDLWVVEGLFDLTALERIIPERDAVVATVRAKLTEKHVTWIRRFIDVKAQVHMVYDNDETGRHGVTGYTHPDTGKFVWGAIQMLERVGVGCRDVRYSGGKDPGEIWERTGTEGLREAFAHALLAA